MCGIVGILSSRAPVQPALLERMRDAMIHRGPDEAGTWISPDGTIGLGHRRLSIIDLAGGQQPMTSSSGDLTIVYNGELYNHVALRKELERLGHCFRTRCDTEVVLNAYREYGDACLERFDGMFSLLVCDLRQGRVFFARDRFGKKPLYYAPIRDGWVFASEIKAILVHPDVVPSVNRQSLNRYLSFLTTTAPETLFEGISKVPAGHCGSWSADAGIHTREWWRPVTGRLDVAPGEAAATVRELFSAAVEKRMMSDVPFGVYLSGGIDSTANVAVMSRIMGRPVDTFSIAFEDEPRLNELPQARSAARHFGTNHCEIEITDDDALRALPEIIHHQDEPIADPVCVPLYHLAQRTKEMGVTVVQIGEGSDEVFFGYPAYVQVLAAARRLWRIRRFVPRAALAAAIQAYGAARPGLLAEFARESVRYGVPAPHGIAGMSESDKVQILGKNGPATSESALAHLRRAVGSAETEEQFADIALAHEARIRLPELLLMRVDKMTMAASVEGRAPFLDRDLVDYVARLPLSVRYEGNVTKAPLKAAMRGIVPDEVLDRPKQGFGAPVWRWSGSFRHLARLALSREALAEYLSPGAVTSLLDGPPTPRRGFQMWVLLNFALWHAHFIEGEDVAALVERAQGTTTSSNVQGAARSAR